MQALLAAILLTFLVSSIAWGEPPSRPLSSFDRAKQVARNTIYAGHDEEFYCGCRWIPEPPTPSASGGRIDASNCSYKPRKDPNRGARLEWEHVVPAKFFGQHTACWRKGHEACVKKDGKPYKGRNCCSKVDKTFRRIEADLHNLTPSIGEINGDRSDLPYGIVEGEPREYGQCDFEIGGKPRVNL
jgi:deoxyribonuclease-1